MRQPVRKLALAALAAALVTTLPFAAPLSADEGMWMPQQIPGLAPRLAELGFAGDPAIWTDLTGFPMGAVIFLGGCSASFISPEGLIATNHHCVQGALQYNSTPDRNLIVDGYLARTRAEELWNGPGSRVWVTVKVTEVTEAITGGIDPELSDRARYGLIERRAKERTAACEQEGLRCRVASFFEGLRWYEIAQLEIQDVRLVHAPPQGIGNFGGETDNWQWPRHTGDFSFYRAYVGPDGKPAPHAAENVPYRPQHWLKISPAGASPGEVVFVAGYPGRTQRHETYAEVEERATWLLPRSIRRAVEQLAILEEVTKAEPVLAIKGEGRRRGLHNGLTKNRGVLEGLERGGLLAQKRERQRALEAWIAADAARQAEYGAVLPALDALAAEKSATRERDATLSALPTASSLLGAAQQIHRLAVEREKEDFDRDPAFQERNWIRIREGLERMQRTYDPRLDRAFFRYVLREAAALPEGQRIAPLDAALGWTAGMPAAEAETRIEAYLDGYYAATRLGDPALRLGLLELPAGELAASDDPALRLAVALHPFAERLREQEKERDGRASRLRPVYMRALLAKSGGLVAPDANATLRVTFGRVQGVDPRDGMRYTAQTRLQGIVEKHTGEGEFDAPERLLAAIAALRAGKETPYFDQKLGDVPVNYLADVDTTGGNSGSAALNAKGELVGLLFDGTYGTVASDLVFDTERTRSIVVDSRYLLWTWEEVENADHLLAEVGLR
ncbi:MAG TPA: S46 family peptidase [Thermoanaerobaculia bacterium]|nr:S46 family peptidase [Thermoanaerobaculia bacterium]